MNRDEAHGRYDLHVTTMTAIDKIYDDFDSRTCENCSYYQEVHGSCYIMNIDINIMPLLFGCNQFKKDIQWQDR